MPCTNGHITFKSLFEYVISMKKEVKERPTKILAASDIHEDRKMVKKLAEKAYREKVDLVVLCGDLTFFDMDWKGTIGPFKEKGLEVVFIPGNHDSPETVELLVEKYKIKNLQDCSVLAGDIGIFGCGGANVGPYPISEKELYETLKRNFRYVKDAKKKIMVTHMPPAGTLIEKFSFPCSKSVRKAIEALKPDLHLSGHMHETEGLEEYIGKTKVMSIGKHGKIIKL